MVYGFPLPETLDAAERGEITLGGCIPDLPVERPCPTCGISARELRSGGTGEDVAKSRDG